jgi:signal transduction histidine kinase
MSDTLTVRVTRRHTEALDIEISDNGRGASHDQMLPGGHGLIGMQERVDLCGGELSAGPKRGGGFVVKARLPLTDAGANA